MTKFWLGALLQISAVLASQWLIPSSVKAETPTLESELLPASVEEQDNAMAQVTSVSQLSDVQTTDWAFQALQSLVERYGCIAGYPDGTFRGNRALTRYEFAAGLNACLDRVNELIATATTSLVTKEDLVAIAQLREQFAIELATLKGRIDVLEASTAELQANQFSTTTKLSGLVWANVTGAFAGDDVLLESTELAPPASFGGVVARRAARDTNGNPVVATRTEDPEVTLSNLVWLSFNTSFTGKDSLVVQLAAGNGDSPANQFTSAGLYNTFGVPFFDQTAGIQGLGNTVVIRELFYQFPVADTLQLVVGTRVNWYRYFDNNAFIFILNGANSFDSNSSTLLNSIDRGSGGVAIWQPSKQFRLAVGYLGENDEFLSNSIAPGFNTSSDPNFGLFGGNYTATAEATFSPSDRLNLRFLYNRARTQAINGVVGGAISDSTYQGVADDGVSAIFDPLTGTVADGGLDHSMADVFEFNFDWLIAKSFGIFGRYTYASTNLKPINQDINAQAIQAGVAFPNLGKEGALFTLSYIIPFSILDGRQYLVSGGGDGGIQYEFEANYFYPITDNIALVPAFYLIANPNNFSSNPNIYVANLRAQFSF
ncbi:iron uptake porin [Synechocystis sp. PCC 7509]|uniref:iron uptake porin n=1 Tax=Synechocystis sp. PCC 7509 TaxID=927677 RepID=UPI0002AD0601|nr:iron uptake porin [Synechocystis sp. PCC 7509]